MAGYTHALSGKHIKPGTFLYMISAQIITDSLNPTGDRLTTFILKFPRIVLAELNTHRAFSKNSASSRAIPFKKMLQKALEEPFIPMAFQKEHKGMQGLDYFEGEEKDQCVRDWLSARDSAVQAATSFKYKITKQLANRLLEPFLMHTVILSGTEFENFFALRFHRDAEIHIADLAAKMLDEYNKSEPKLLNVGEWHVPFGDKIDADKLAGALRSLNIINEVLDLENYVTFSKKIAVARCARISYDNFEGKDDYEADIDLCDKLFGSIPRHLSPTEHVAQAMDESKFIGNFKGFKQYRKFFEGENATDVRVKKHDCSAINKKI